MSLRSQTTPATEEGALSYHSRTLEIETEEHSQFIKLTESIRNVVDNSGIREGQVFVFSKHTTAGVVIQEDEPLLLEDFKEFFEDVVPRQGEYKHNDFEIRTVNMEDEESKNAHSHCRHITVGPSETLPISEGEVITGEWQDVFLLELDGPREREVFIQVSGV